MRVFLLILGIALLVVSAQGAIRLVADHADTGLLSWVPGGFAVQLGAYILLVCLGVLLAARNSKGIVDRS
ncbi:hypothetical protein GCM10027413_04890 [Conyzicola nivalis]|uniref:Uncharacterized protein n=1 Tax=Conyzicola nivalis TaxID=1477021 RepID=A0A916SNY7_9MICO|nr:hypothetical protein [Conyzicola nivalis]GGB06849.1 hypothetical protein GCM10010979_21740 [Conyzicola nivalis]